MVCYFQWGKVTLFFFSLLFSFVFSALLFFVAHLRIIESCVSRLELFTFEPIFNFSIFQSSFENEYAFCLYLYLTIPTVK